MKFLASVSSCILALLIPSVVADEADRVRKQQQLDEACEVARENKLQPLRQQYVQECVEKSYRDKAHCERFYSDYGARTGNRAPLFYDLPECMEAFRYRKSYRQAN